MASCTVRSFSEATGVAAPQILRILLKEGAVANLNSELDPVALESANKALDAARAEVTAGLIDLDHLGL